MRVEEELERKRAELMREIQTLALRIETIKGQVSAIDQVIAIYDPAHAPKIAAPVKTKRIRNNVSVPVALNRINKSEAILEVLREAGGPLSTADCTRRVAERHGVSASDPGLGPAACCPANSRTDSVMSCVPRPVAAANG